MAQTKLNSNQFGNDTKIWTKDSLHKGNNISFERNVNLYVVTQDTLTLVSVSENKDKNTTEVFA